MSEPELFSDNTEDEGLNDKIDIYQTSSGSDLETEEEAYGYNEDQFLKSAFSKKSKSASNANCGKSKAKNTHSEKNNKTVSTSRNDTPLSTRKSSAQSLLPALNESTGSACEENNSAPYKQLTTLLTYMSKRLEQVEIELREQRQQTPRSGRCSCSSNSSTESSPKNVPLVVRSEVRKMYSDLLDGDTSFSGFTFSSKVGFKDPQNKACTKTLIEQVKCANPEFQAAQIRSAVYTYYTSLSSENRLKKSGRHDERKRARRRRERLLRKLHERQSTLTKSKLPEKEKEKWKKILVSEMMSSEESDTADEEVILVKKLPWRAERVTQFLKQLDSRVNEDKKAQAKRQRKQRIYSQLHSSRREHVVPLPQWSITKI